VPSQQTREPRQLRALDVLNEILEQCGWIQGVPPESNCQDEFFVEAERGDRKEDFYVSNTTIQIVPFDDKVNTFDLYDPKSIPDLIWFLNHGENNDKQKTR